MRNDYTGFGVLKDVEKYRAKLLDVLIKDGMSIEEKTLIRIEVNILNYKEIVKRLKCAGQICVPWRGKNGNIGECIRCGKKI